MKERRQFLVTIRIDAFDSEGVEYFFHNWEDGRITIDPESISGENHEVIESEEIPDVPQG